MTSRNKKYLGNKATAPGSVTAAESAPAHRAQSAVVVELMASRAKAPAQDFSPAAEGLRLVQAFLQIPDPLKRAELIRMAEEYVRRAR
jgi:hypothetical protein